jgi:drug/metabolite transporter (DMT)-like permease
VEDFRQVDGADWLYLAFLAIVVGIVGHVMMSWIHRYVGASRSSLVLLLMNVVSVGAAWPINGERISLVQVLGGLVVLGAVAAVVSRPAGAVVADSPVL